MEKNYKIVNDPEVVEPSGIIVTDNKDNILAHIRGPMSMSVGGAFIQVMDDDGKSKFGYNTTIRTAMDYSV